MLVLPKVAAVSSDLEILKSTADVFVETFAPSPKRVLREYEPPVLKESVAVVSVVVHLPDTTTIKSVKLAGMEEKVIEAAPPEPTVTV